VFENLEPVLERSLKGNTAMPKMSPIKIGYCLSLSGPLAASGHTAWVSHQIWQEHANVQGGLLGRKVELVCVDDRSDRSLVPAIYQRLLTEDKVDLLLGGCGSNSISPAMPVAIEREKFFVSLMGLGVNNELRYDRYFAMIPTGADPERALTAGFFKTASWQTPAPTKVAIVAADAAFTKRLIQGARANAAEHQLEVVSETRYGLDTTDFSETLRQASESDPDILFILSYWKDSVALVRAIAESDVDPIMIGGAMIGPQSGAVQRQLGTLLNGIVNFEYWLPTTAMAFPGVRELIATYQERAKGTQADAFGYYLAPFAYAQLQVVEQAIRETGEIGDTELTEFSHAARFRTVVGDVRFGDFGEWMEPRVLTVQFQGFATDQISEFEASPARVILYPDEYKSGSGHLRVPYRAAKQIG
jgi:branched-chain amino acid transport system substrate-binding protein